MKLSDFLYRVDQIRNEQPKYELGHDGSDGACDCVGLIIGATRRTGTPYKGIHGSNYFAREMTVDLQHINSVKELALGDLVYKAKSPGEEGYKLPDRYKKGGKYYNGDLRDYYHIGVVTSVNPLRITHMTTPTIKVDTSLGKWKYFGKYIKLDDSDSSSKPDEKGDEQMEEQVEIYGGNETSPINLRLRPTTSSQLVERIPQHSIAQYIEKSGDWVKVKYGGKTGYVMAVFVHSDEALAPEDPEVLPTEDEDTVQKEGAIILTLNYPQAIALLPILDNLREQIVQKIGRG